MPASLPVFLPVWRSPVNYFMLSNPAKISSFLWDFLISGYAFGTAMLSYRSRNLTIQKQVPHLIISNRPLPLIFQKLCWIRRYDKVYYIRACFSIKKAAISFIAAFLYKAGTEGLEPSTFGFGDQRSTNWTISLYYITYTFKTSYRFLELLRRSSRFRYASSRWLCYAKPCL